MIDFVKYELKRVDPERLELNPLLEFHNKVNTKTAELGKYLNAFYKGLEFKIFDTTMAKPQKRITVEGSLHKYWNKGAHNFNDFGIDQINEVLQDLKQQFEIKAENCTLKQLEIGVNINPPQKTKSILKQCLMHKTDRLKWVHTNDEGNYIQSRRARSIIKIYDKRTHYKNRGFSIEDEVLRFEIKYIKMLHLKQKGIITMEDLLQYGLHNFTSILLQEWSNVIFYEYKALKGTDYENKYSNPNFWENLSKSNRQYHRSNLKALTENHPQNIKETIAELIKKKCTLLNTSTIQMTPLHIRVKGIVSGLGKTDPNRRVCRLTGVNISMQKNGSDLLSHTGLKYYYKTDPKIFNEVKRKYLSEVWINADHKTQIKEIAHNIRNTINNQRTKQKRLYKENQMQLFNIT